MYAPLLIDALKSQVPKDWLNQPEMRLSIYDSVIAPQWYVGATSKDKQPPNGGAFCIVFQNVGGVPAYFSEGAIADKRNVRLQITIWANNPRDRYLVSDWALETLMKHPNFEPLTEVNDLYDQTAELYGARFDVSCWFLRK